MRVHGPESSTHVERAPLPPRRRRRSPRRDRRDRARRGPESPSGETPHSRNKGESTLTGARPSEQPGRKPSTVHETGASPGVRLLLDWRADPEARSISGATPMHLAAREGHVETAAFLCKLQKPGGSPAWTIGKVCVLLAPCLRSGANRGRRVRDDPARAATVPPIPPDRTNPTEAARTRNF